MRFNSGLIDKIIENEGGLVDHQNDKGGLTKFGITEVSWSEYSQYGEKATDVGSITLAQAREFYRHRFEKAKITLLPSIYWYPVADWQVNSGKHAIKCLQRVFNELGSDLFEDGILGEVTARTARTYNSTVTVDKYISERIRFYCAIVAKNPSQSVFLNGWINRSIKLFSWNLAQTFV